MVSEVSLHDHPLSTKSEEIMDIVNEFKSAAEPSGNCTLALHGKMSRRTY